MVDVPCERVGYAILRASNVDAPLLRAHAAVWRDESYLFSISRNSRQTRLKGDGTHPSFARFALAAEEMQRRHEEEVTALRDEIKSVREECTEEVNLATLEVKTLACCFYYFNFNSAPFR